MTNEDRLMEQMQQDQDLRNQIDQTQKRLALEEQRRALERIEAKNRSAHENHILALMEEVAERRIALEKKLESHPQMAKLIKKQLQALGCEESKIIAMVEVEDEPARDNRGRFAKQLNGTHN